MANSLNENITGRYVVLSTEGLKPEYHGIENRVFLVQGGFGADSFTAGTAVFGSTPFDGDEFRISGFDIERFATDDEIALVTKKEA